LRKPFYLTLSLLFASAAHAAGGVCPTGADYYNAAGTSLVTLGSLGITNCYYIASSGSDFNSGTTATAPWAHLPGMSTCTGNCLTLKNAGVLAGTGFILRGGDTWNGSNLGIYWPWGGTATNPVYIGVDLAWYAGDSWSRPIWTCGGVACVANAGYFFQTPTNKSYDILDDIEFTGLVDTGNTPVYIAMYGTYQTVERIYVHGWSTTLTTNNSASQALTFTAGSNNIGDTIRYSVFDGADTAKNMMFVTHTGTPVAYGNVLTNVYTGFDGCGDTWHDNLLDNAMVQGVVTGHQDGLYHYTQCNNPNSLIYNNVIRNATNSSTAGAVKLWINGNGPCPFSSCTSYMFNNIIYNTYPGNTFDTGGHFAQNYGTWYIFNNTIDCGTDSVEGHCSELGDNGNVEATSTTSNTIGAGPKTFKVQSGLSLSFFSPGSPFLVWPTGNPSIYMAGRVISFSGSIGKNLVANITSTSGSGAYSRWTMGGTMTLIRSNNHYISTGSLHNNCTHYTCSQTNDLAQTLSRAKAQGYTSNGAYAFQPVSASGSTVGTGTTESSLCTAVSAIDANAGAACGNATGYACSYNSTNHTVTCPALTPLSRGSTWDKGAYEYNGTPTVATPTFSLTAEMPARPRRATAQ
jgi:hypothetical protein